MINPVFEAIDSAWLRLLSYRKKQLSVDLADDAL